MQKHPSLLTPLHILLVSACYIYLLLPVLADPGLFPSHDNLRYHFSNYAYFSNSLKYAYGFPLWYPSNGGAQIGIFSLSLFPFLPYRLLGYLLYLLLPFQMVTLYKMTIVAGMLMAAAGWWLFLRRLTGSRSGATFGCLMVLLGGTGITVLHQEQVLATMTWAPWVMLTMLRVGKTPACVVLLAALLGFSVTTHYPHIQVLVFFALLVSLAITGKITTAFIRPLIAGRKVFLFASIAFILSASPLLYVHGVMEDFSSPLRGTAGLRISGYDEYIRLNRIQSSSAPPAYLMNYAVPRADSPHDRYAFYATVTGIAAAAAGLVLSSRAALVPFIVLLVCAWASIGVNGYLPQLLYHLKLPFVLYFRQWYHFVPMLNLSLSVMGAIGFTSISGFLAGSADARRERARHIAAALLLTVSAGAMLYESTGYFRGYADRYLKDGYATAELDEKTFLAALTRGGFEYDKPGPMFVYREWHAFSRACPDAAGRSPFITTTFYGNGETERAGSALKRFCETGAAGYAVLVDVPADGGVETLPGMIPLKDGRPLPSERIKNPNRGLSAREYAYTPKGASARGRAGSTSLVVFPFSYKIGLRANLNGRQARTYSVYGGAMTGVPVPAGEFHIELRVPFSWYQPAVLAQYLLLAGVVALPLLSVLVKKG